MKKTQVRLMNEYSVDWPLWIDGLTKESEWELSEPLKRRLKLWAALFNEHFNWQHGWDAPASRALHRSEGAELHRLLADELGPKYKASVVFD